MITPAQIRAARAIVNMKQADLAAAAEVSLATLNNIERGVTDPRASTLTAIQKALEAAGVIFIVENGEGPGVRLRKHAGAPAGRGASQHPILENIKDIAKKSRPSVIVMENVPGLLPSQKPTPDDQGS